VAYETIHMQTAIFMPLSTVGGDDIMFWGCPSVRVWVRPSVQW